MSLSVGDVKQYLKDTALLDDASTKTTRQAVVIIRRVLELINSSHEWSFYRKDLRFNTIPTDSGLASISNGSTTLTLDDANDFRHNPTGQHIRLNSGSELYTIASQTGTAVELVSPYQGSDLSSANFVLYNDTYEVPSGIRNIQGLYPQQQYGKLDYLYNEDFMADLRDFGPQTQVPWEWTDVRHEVSGTLAVRFYPSPNASGTIDGYAYRHPQEPSETDTDVVDWDPEKDELFWAALDYVASRATWRGKENPVQVMAFMRDEFDKALARAQAIDNASLDDDDPRGDIGIWRYPATGRQT